MPFYESRHTVIKFAKVRIRCTLGVPRSTPRPSTARRAHDPTDVAPSAQFISATEGRSDVRRYVRAAFRASYGLKINGSDHRARGDGTGWYGMQVGRPAAPI